MGYWADPFERNLVFVALGEGRFAPRDVVIGVESGDDFYQIIEGLSAGEEIVTSAQFLLDSESKLQESLAKMLSIRKSDQLNHSGEKFLVLCTVKRAHNL